MSSSTTSSSSIRSHEETDEEGEGTNEFGDVPVPELPTLPNVLRRHSKLLTGELDFSALAMTKTSPSEATPPAPAPVPAPANQAPTHYHRQPSGFPSVQGQQHQLLPQSAQRETQGESTLASTNNTVPKESLDQMLSPMPSRHRPEYQMQVPFTAPVTKRSVALTAERSAEAMATTSTEFQTPSKPATTRIPVSNSIQETALTSTPQVAGPQRAVSRDLASNTSNRIELASQLNSQRKRLLPSTSPLKEPPLSMALPLTTVIPGHASRAASALLPATAIGRPHTQLTHVHAVPHGTVTIPITQPSIYQDINTQLMDRNALTVQQREADMVRFGAALALDGRSLMAQLNEERAHLASAMAALQDERIRSRRLEQECNIYRSQSIDYKSAIARSEELERKLETTVQLVQVQQTREQQLSKELDELVHVSEKERAVFTATEAALREEISRLQEQASSAMASLMHEKADSAALRERVQQLEKELSSKDEVWKAKLEQEMQASQEREAGLKDRLHQAEASKLELEAVIAKESAQRQANEASMRAALKELETKVETAEARCTELEQNLQAENTAHRSATDELACSKEETSRWREAYEKMKEERDEARRSLYELQRHIDNVVAERNAMEEREKEALGNLAEFEELKRALQLKVKRSQNLEGRCHELEDSLNDAIATNETLKLRLQQKEAELLRRMELAEERDRHIEERERMLKAESENIKAALARISELERELDSVPGGSRGRQASAPSIYENTLKSESSSLLHSLQPTVNLMNSREKSSLENLASKLRSTPSLDTAGNSSKSAAEPGRTPHAVDPNASRGNEGGQPLHQSSAQLTKPPLFSREGLTDLFLAAQPKTEESGVAFVTHQPVGKSVQGIDVSETENGWTAQLEGGSLINSRRPSRSQSHSRQSDRGFGGSESGDERTTSDAESARSSHSPAVIRIDANTLFSTLETMKQTMLHPHTRFVANDAPVSVSQANRPPIAQPRSRVHDDGTSDEDQWRSRKLFGAGRERVGDQDEEDSESEQLDEEDETDDDVDKLYPYLRRSSSAAQHSVGDQKKGLEVSLQPRPSLYSSQHGLSTSESDEDNEDDESLQSAEQAHHLSRPEGTQHPVKPMSEALSQVYLRHLLTGGTLSDETIRAIKQMYEDDDEDEGEDDEEEEDAADD